MTDADRIAQLEAHRRQWRTRALRLYDALAMLSRASEDVLMAPVRMSGLTMSAPLREQLQRTMREAQSVLALEQPEDEGKDAR